MTDFLIIVSYLLPIVLVCVMHVARLGSAFQVSATSLLLFFYFLNNHFGLIFQLYFPDERVTLTESVFFLLCMYSCIVIFAYLCVQIALPYKTSPRLINVDSIGDSRVNNFFILALFSLCAFLLLQKIQGSALEYFFTKGVEEAKFTRLGSKSGQIFGIKERYFNFLFHALDILALVILHKAFSNRSLVYWLYFTILLAITVLWTSTNLSKGALLKPFLYVIFVYAMLRYKGVFLNRFTFIIFVFALALVSIISAQMMGADFEVFYALERQLIGNLLPQIYVVNHFSVDNMLLGASAPEVFSFYTHNQFVLDQWTWKAMHNWVSGPYYSAPSSFVADAHANFNFVGVIAYSIIAFTLCRLFDTFCIKIRDDAVYSAVVVWGGLHFSYMAVTGIYNRLIDYYLLGALLVTWFYVRLRFR